MPQLLAYCTALHLPLGHVVYASGNEAPTAYVVRHAGVRTACHALDLDVDSAVLLGQITKLADSLTPAASVEGSQTARVVPAALPVRR